MNYYKGDSIYSLSPKKQLIKITTNLSNKIQRLIKCEMSIMPFDILTRVITLLTAYSSTLPTRWIKISFACPIGGPWMWAIHHFKIDGFEEIG